MLTNNDRPTDPAVWGTMSWANAVSVARAARRSVTEPLCGAGMPAPSAPATELAGATEESAVTRLLRLIERIVEVCP